MKLDFKNKIILITGGEGGLGKAICNKFLQLGARVIVTTTKKKLVNKKTKKKIYMYLDFSNKNSITSQIPFTSGTFIPIMSCRTTPPPHIRTIIGYWENNFHN